MRTRKTLRPHVNRCICIPIRRKPSVRRKNDRDIMSFDDCAYKRVVRDVGRKEKKIAFQIHCVCTQLTIRKREKTNKQKGTREKKKGLVRGGRPLYCM